jgi:hypothetical protein
MHAGTGFGDDALLAHPLGQQGLADAVVDLVRAGVIQILALQIDLRAAPRFGETSREIQPAWAADVFVQVRFELFLNAESRFALSYSAVSC